MGSRRQTTSLAQQTQTPPCAEQRLGWQGQGGTCGLFDYHRHALPMTLTCQNPVKTQSGATKTEKHAQRAYNIEMMT